MTELDIGDSIRDTWSAVVEVHRSPLYVATALAVTVGALSLFVLSNNLPFFLDFVVAGDASLGRKLSALVALYPFVGDGFDLPTSIALLALSLLMGANVAMILYRFVEIGVIGGGGSAVGGVLGTLGAGCAACGSALLAAVFGVSASAGMLAFLPLHGVEIAVVAGAVLLLSLHWTAETLNSDPECEI